MREEENIILPVLAGLTILAVFSSDSKPVTTVPDQNYLPSNYIKAYWNDAKRSQALTGVPAIVTITQGGLESGWGKHAPGNNHFGIKAGSSWTGATQLLHTKEYINGQMVDVLAKFRAYPNAAASFTDHGNFLRDNPRYKKAFEYKNDPINFAKQLQAAGYATDPEYANKLIASMKLVAQILKSNGLI